MEDRKSGSARAVALPARANQEPRPKKGWATETTEAGIKASTTRKKEILTLPGGAASEEGRYQGSAIRDQEGREKKVVTFDRKASPFAKSAEDGVPSSSLVALACERKP